MVMEMTTHRQARAGPEGLEQYLDDGVIKTALSGVTENVNTAKTSLDEYRDERSERRLAQNTNTDENAPSSGASKGTPEETSSGETRTDVDSSGFGTITRTSIENSGPSLLKALRNLSALSLIQSLRLPSFHSLYISHIPVPYSSRSSFSFSSSY